MRSQEGQATLRWPALVALVLVACSEAAIVPPTRRSITHRAPLHATDGGPAVTHDAHVAHDAATWEVPAEPQREGDPALGYRALVNEGYVTCGIPARVYRSLFGAAPAAMRLPDRDARNAPLPYNFTASVSPRGHEIVSANCLTCHASVLRGRLVVGLGSANVDYTQNTGALALGATFLGGGAAERAELSLWGSRVGATADYLVTRTVGVNPADNLAAALFAHRDPRTLAWSDRALLDPPPREVVPVDVPPWWRMRKKNAMFYNASGRGDHARIMMTASALCTDSVAEARRIDAYFPHVRAYLRSLRPPPWPWPVDAPLAERGREVFDRTCARCHGTYGDGESYPNLVVGLRSVGTDPVLARGAAQFSGRFVDWYRDSFYGERSRIEPQEGYVAPPLDGVWATAPFLHNGSVPTLATLLDSRARPRFWTRDFDDTDSYDRTAVGWSHAALDHGQRPDDPPRERARIYDTTLPGYSNAGHTYGDRLTDDERRAVIEYLKTL